MLLLVVLCILCLNVHAFEKLSRESELLTIPSQASPHSAVISVGNFRDLHLCNGILVAEDVAITAAHCVNGLQNDIYVRVKSKVVAFGGQVTRVRKNCPLSGYDFLTKRNDISILRLSKPVSSITPAKLSIHDNSQHNLRGKTTVHGWGFNTKGLKEVLSVTLVKQSVCTEEYGNDVIIGGMACAAYRGAGNSCLNDAQGSPIMLKDTVLGIIAAVGTCTSSGPPAVYTRIPENLQSEIDKCV